MLHHHHRSPLDLDHDTMRRLGHRVADVVAEHLATLREQRAFSRFPQGGDAWRRDVSPPRDGQEFETLLDHLRGNVFRHAAREPHPGFVAYVPSCPTFPAVLGDWLATGYNFFAGAWQVAEGPNALEALVLDWFRQWTGMPEGTRGLLTSGGSTATLIAMVAARHAVVGEEADRISRLTVYLSDQTHSSAVRAAWIAGVPRAQVRMLPTEADFRLVPNAVEKAIAADRARGLIPFMVVANAGTANTGAVDPLGAIADLCQRERIWFHIDAAYGGFAVLTPVGRRALAGVERADSVTIDPHKWLYVPFECGCLLAREPGRLYSMYHIMPDYLRDAAAVGEAVNFADYGEQLSRYSRAIKVWLSVSYFGVDAIAEAIAESLSLAPHAETLVRADPDMEVLAPATLGILCFRVRPRGLSDPQELDALNERIVEALREEGRFFISTTRLGGRLSLRICPLGFRTTRGDMEELISAVAVLARQAQGHAAGRRLPADSPVAG